MQKQPQKGKKPQEKVIQTFEPQKIGFEFYSKVWRGFHSNQITHSYNVLHMSIETCDSPSGWPNRMDFGQVFHGKLSNSSNIYENNFNKCPWPTKELGLSKHLYSSLPKDTIYPYILWAVAIPNGSWNFTHFSTNWSIYEFTSFFSLQRGSCFPNWSHALVMEWVRILLLNHSSATQVPFSCYGRRFLSPAWWDTVFQNFQHFPQCLGSYCIRRKLQ